MNPSTRQTLVLTEYTPARFERDLFSAAEGQQLWQRYSRYVNVDFPSPKTDEQWQLTANGWVGYLPLSPSLGFSLQPKLPLHNLFRLVEVAYGLQGDAFSNDLFTAATLLEFYDRLALFLARQIEARCRTGLYHTTKTVQADLSYVRGSLQVDRMLCSPWQMKVPCRFDELTADVEENHILIWTIWRLLCSDLTSPNTQLVLRHVYRTLLGYVSLQPVSVLECINRQYNRLNEDYRGLHALCRFFLEQSGPSHNAGDHEMYAFLLDMAYLYERFVAAWLGNHISAPYQIQAQERVYFGNERQQHFAIDVVIYNREKHTPYAVLDTKYKAPTASPSSSDIAQVVAYATAKECREAILLYPVPLARPLDEQIGSVRVRSLSFTIDGDIDQAGQELLAQIFM